MNAHTLGPWSVEDGDVVDREVEVVVDPFRTMVCRVPPGRPNAKADVRLIAAAPELLAVARTAPCQTQAEDRYSRTCDEVRAMEGTFERSRCPRCAAIAKVEGRS